MSSVCEIGSCPSLREESWGSPSHKKAVLCSTAKRKRDVCKILFKEVKILPNKQPALSGLLGLNQQAI